MYAFESIILYNIFNIKKKYKIFDKDKIQKNKIIIK